MTSTPFWSQEQEDRLERIREDLAKVSTASACQLLLHHGWRNTYMVGLRPLQPLGLGKRLVGRAQNVPVPHAAGAGRWAERPETRRRSAEIN